MVASIGFNITFEPYPPVKVRFSTSRKELEELLYLTLYSMLLFFKHCQAFIRISSVLHSINFWRLKIVIIGCITPYYSRLIIFIAYVARCYFAVLFLVLHYVLVPCSF